MDGTDTQELEAGVLSCKEDGKGVLFGDQSINHFFILLRACGELE